MRRPRCHRALLVFALQCGFAAAKKRKQPAVPAELLSGCPFHREKASTDELSEFGHELERDGRKLEAERCYARAIRSSPQAATGWFDLAAARQYSDQSAAIRYYRHGLKLRPSGEPSRAPAGSLLRPVPPRRAAAQVSNTTSSAWSCGRRRGGRASARGATSRLGAPQPPSPPQATRSRPQLQPCVSPLHRCRARQGESSHPPFLTARRHAEAAQQFRTAARLQPADADALFNLGGSHELLAQPAEALHAYRGAPG